MTASKGECFRAELPETILYVVERADPQSALLYVAQGRIRWRGRIREPLLPGTLGLAGLDPRAPLGRL